MAENSQNSIENSHQSFTPIWLSLMGNQRRQINKRAEAM